MQFLFALAVLPAVLLCIYVYKKDRHEKEPMKFLIRLLIAGAVISIPVMLIETAAESVLVALFDSSISLVEDEYSFDSYSASLGYNFLSAFFGVALVEEGFKFLALYLLTRRNKDFNSLFDGMIYSVFVSLGFAALENVLYVFSGGVETALIRMVTAVPGHMCFGVLMGYFYSYWHLYDHTAKLEENLMRTGTIPAGKPKFAPKKYLVLTLVCPVLGHGFYDFCCFMADYFWIVIFYAFLIALFVFCFLRVKNLSKQDTGDFAGAAKLLVSAYPMLQQSIIEQTEVLVYGQPAPTAPTAAAAGPAVPPLSSPVRLAPVTERASRFYTVPDPANQPSQYKSGTPRIISADTQLNGYQLYNPPYGGRYYGYMENGHAHGYGTYTTPGGIEIRGYWVNGVLQ